MQINDVASPDTRVREAERLLAQLLGVPLEQAAVSLDLQSQFNGVSLSDAAQQVMDGYEHRLHDGPPSEADDRALAILRGHLDPNGHPLDVPTA